MRRKINIWKNIDWFTIILYLILVLAGWFNIYAAVYNEDHSSIFDLSQKYGKQMLWIVAAFVLIVVIMLIESRFYAFFAYPLFGFMLFLLVVVLLFGTEVNASKSWITLGSFRLQPGEFAKFATALALARLLSSYNFKIHKFKNIILIGVIVLSPAALILLQNDTGSALVYATFVFVLFREGLNAGVLLFALFIAILFILTLTIPLIYILIFILLVSLVLFLLLHSNKRSVLHGAVLFVSIFGVLILLNYLTIGVSTIKVILTTVMLFSIYTAIKAILKKYMHLLVIIGVALSSIVFIFTADYFFEEVLGEHQRKRINNLLGIEADPLGAGYNVNQSKIAIGSGGFNGKGFLKGTQTKYDFVPEQSTDFIFCTVGEEWGFVGSSTIIGLFVVLMLRLIFLAERQRSSFSRIYGYGVVAVLFFHVTVNVGMTIGLAPVIGIPLPFFSYGGSSLWAFTALLFVFIRLDSSRRELLR